MESLLDVVPYSFPFPLLIPTPLWVKRDLLRGRYSSLREYMSSTKAAIAKRQIRTHLEMLSLKDSKFWEVVKGGIGAAVAIAEDVDEANVNVFFDEFNLDQNELDVLRVIIEFGILEKTSFSGNFVLNIEGVVGWPRPDPDLEFEWHGKVERNGLKSLMLTILVRFVRVQGPGIGWVLGVLGYLLGAPYGLVGRIFGAAGGVAIGEFIDLRYESPEAEADVIQTFSKIYEGTHSVTWDAITFTLSRPDERSFQLSTNIDFTRLTLEGLFG